MCMMKLATDRTINGKFDGKSMVALIKADSEIRPLAHDYTAICCEGRVQRCGPG